MQPMRVANHGGKSTLFSMDMNDNRLKKIVFVSLCILNQNVRFPGIAVEAGACTGLLKMLMGHGLGIETLPCCERLGWGGVSRKAYFRYQPFMLRHADSWYSGLLALFARLWVFRYSLLCRREARRAAGNIQDYVKSGYTIAGIISMNDSPTDGVTNTIDLVHAWKRFKTLSFSEEMLTAPDIARMKGLIRDLCEPGTGIFISHMKNELERKGIGVKITGYDPWEAAAAECVRIEQELGLREEQTY
jgi:hypothetical protein